MIRLVVAVIGLLLLLMWVAAPFAKRTKILISALALVAIITLASMEVYNNKPRSGLIDPVSISVCGLNVTHSYRSDYKVALCLENTTSATVKRIAFQVDGLRCPASSQNDNEPKSKPEGCKLLDSATRDVLLTIEAGAQTDLQETLRFDALTPAEADVTWSASILDIKAVP